MLICEELEKHAEYGRLLALRNLKSRGTCIGAFLPLSLLFIISYGYLVKYQNTAENQLTSELQSVLKSFDAEKTAILREYRSAFAKAISDEQVIKLIEEKGIEDIAVVKRVLDIFENNKGNHLPILGVKILDESGRGAFIKINNRARYSLLVTWDDKALDDSIVQKAFDNYALKNSEYNFAGLRIKAQNVDYIGRKTRHVSQKLWSKITEKAKLVSLENKSSVFKEDNNIVFAMPSLSFSRMVFVGWIDRANIDVSIFIRRMVFLSLAVLSIILLCSIRSASVFLKPVNELKKALDEVIVGNLNVSLKNPPNDELGKLSNEFSNMINSLREKERLSKLISDQAVQAVKKQSDILFDNTETFNGVALVSDIRNFTGMSEQYDPVLITNLLNEHFAEMAKVISDNGGLIYKFIGDAIEAVFPEKEDYVDARKKILNNIIGEKTELYSMRTIYFRRSALATIEKRDAYLNTNIIYDKDKKKLLAYVFCAIPIEIQNNYLINYSKDLTGKYTLLAFNNNDEWHFSNSFSENEKLFLKQNYKNKNLLTDKGYWLDHLKIGNKIWDIYAVKKELISYNKPDFSFNIIVFISSILFFFIFLILIKKLILYNVDSLISKLSVNIIISTILPLCIVGFVSYLYVNEDYSVNKTETRLKLNSLLEELENKDYYYHPLCVSYLEKVSKSDQLKDLVSKHNSSINKKDKKELIKKIRDYLDENICGNHNNKFKIDPHYSIREAIVIGRGDWLTSICEKRGDRKREELTELGKIVSEIGKTVFLKRDESSAQAVKNGILVDQLLETLSAIFGGELTNRIINFPKSLIFTTSSFTTVAIYMVPVPSNYDPDYVVLSWVFFNNELLPRACELKNNDILSLEKHFNTGSKDNKIFSFYSPNINVGEYFFYDRGNIINNKEDFLTVKELGLASSWINTSFIPVSRTIDLHGTHYLEARQGSIVKDNVYAGIASEIPLKREADIKFYIFISVIIFSVIMIIYIAKNTISDLLAPVKMLMAGVKYASREFYAFRTEFKRGDELGALCESFDKMMKGLEEKQLMNRMVSKSALKVSSNVKDVDSKKINVVLLYVTVPCFDSIMKNTPVYKLFALLREQVSIIAETVIDNGGDIDKIMGEKMLIAFHTGEKKLNDVAVLACKVANMIETSGRIHFKVSVGVNYGQVISGFLGVGDKRDFTIIGDPVNVAARIAVFAEKLKGNRVVVSENIKELVKDKIETEEYGEVALKGKSMPLKVFRII